MTQPIKIRISGVRRLVRKKVHKNGIHENGCKWESTSSVPDYYEVGEIELTADLQALAKRLGEKAMGNRSGRSTAAWKHLTARVTSRKRAEPA